MPFQLSAVELTVAQRQIKEIEHQLEPMGQNSAGRILSTLAMPLVAKRRLTDVQAEQLVTHLSYKFADVSAFAVEAACKEQEQRSPFFPSYSVPKIDELVGNLKVELLRLIRLRDFNVRQRNCDDGEAVSDGDGLAINDVHRLAERPSAEERSEDVAKWKHVRAELMAGAKMRQWARQRRR